MTPSVSRLATTGELTDARRLVTAQGLGAVLMAKSLVPTSAPAAETRCP